MPNEGGQNSNERDEVDAILSRAEELANSGGGSDPRLDAEMLAGFREGVLSLDDVDETSLEQCLHAVGLDGVLAPFRERAEALKETEAELSILRILWERGSQSVRQILTEKGLMERDESQRPPQIYKPQLPQRQTLRQFLGDLLQLAFGGSAKALVLQALSTQKASPEELEAIEKLLDRLEEKNA